MCKMNRLEILRHDEWYTQEICYQSTHLHQSEGENRDMQQKLNMQKGKLI